MGRKSDLKGVYGPVGGAFAASETSEWSFLMDTGQVKPKQIEAELVVDQDCGGQYICTSIFRAKAEAPVNEDCPLNKLYETRKVLPGSSRSDALRHIGRFGGEQKRSPLPERVLAKS